MDGFPGLLGPLVFAAGIACVLGMQRAAVARRGGCGGRGVRVGYVTDVEGNADFFQRYVEASRVLRWDGDRLELQEDNDYFVFGGDLFDRGPYDMRLCDLLVDLKSRHPSRVALLLGNRDLNKLRFSAELELSLPASSFPAPFWDPARPPLAAWLEARGAQDGRVARVQYILEETMGCPHTFEDRRKELREGGREGTDEEVAQSFLDALGPDGAYMRYMRAAQIGFCCAGTLFVHGGVTDRNLFWVPSLRLPYIQGREEAMDGYGRYLDESASVHEWMDELNSFAQAALDEHEAFPSYEGEPWKSFRGGDALMAFQSTPATCGRTVVVAAHIDRGVVRPPSERVQRRLAGSGLRRLVVGHKPAGSSPLVVRTEHMELINADTSYSDPTAPDRRGQAVSEVVIEEDGGSTQASIHGRLPDGRAFDFPLASIETATGERRERRDGAAAVGSVTEDGWWVKADLGEDGLLLARTTGRSVEYNVWTEGATARATAGGQPLQAVLATPRDA